jgi:hypothetical protein
MNVDEHNYVNKPETNVIQSLSFLYYHNFLIYLL